ncbi:MAG TPA: hypothetical protein VD907_06540 [Verrucomicrobiae bacterium]|nr:hypothetical protein [Verrucomicrobiae bacterium]
MDKNRPTKKQHELLQFIDGFIKTNGYGPSYREIMNALRYKSVSTVATHIDGLIARGFLRKRDNSARSLEVIRSGGVTAAPKAAPIKETDARWLLALIDARFRAAELRPTSKQIDNLFVLVGALHVLGLDDAHRAFKTRLLAVHAKLESS